MLTELEKTVLMSFYIMSKGSTRKYIEKEGVVNKYPARHRKTVRRYIKDLEQKKLIIKHKEEEKYKLNKKGLKKVAELIAGGVSVRL